MRGKGKRQKAESKPPENSQKHDLLADSDGEADGEARSHEIRINSAFAAKYEERKRKELLSKNKELLQELSGEEA